MKTKSENDCKLSAVDIISMLVIVIFGVFICLACFVDTNPINDAFMREIFVALFGLITLVVTGYVKKFVSKDSG